MTLGRVVELVLHGKADVVVQVITGNSTAILSGFPVTPGRFLYTRDEMSTEGNFLEWGRGRANHVDFTPTASSERRRQ